MTDEDRKEALTRIEGLKGYSDVLDILDNDPTIFWFITDFFREEQLVRKIVAKENTKHGQLAIYKCLEKNAIDMYRKSSPIVQQEIRKIGLGEKNPPYYFRQIQTDILTRQPIVSEENDVVPAVPRGIKSVDDIFCELNSNIKGQEAKDNQPQEDNRLKAEIAQYKARITELEEEVKQLKQNPSTKNEELLAQVEFLKNDLQAFQTRRKKEKGSPLLTVKQMAIFLKAIFLENNSLTNNVKTLTPLLQRFGGWTETTAESALGYEVTQEECDELAKAFKDYAPAIGTIIISYPKKYKMVKEGKLKNNLKT